jgi:hypothetical protein
MREWTGGAGNPETCIGISLSVQDECNLNPYDLSFRFHPPTPHFERKQKYGGHHRYATWSLVGIITKRIKYISFKCQLALWWSGGKKWFEPIFSSYFFWSSFLLQNLGIIFIQIKFNRKFYRGTAIVYYMYHQLPA